PQKPVTANTPRFNFQFAGSVQGFRVEGAGARIENVVAGGQRGLAIHYTSSAQASTPTFLPLDATKMPGYGLIGSPTLYAGQTIRAEVSGDADAQVNLFVRIYDADDVLQTLQGEPTALRAGETRSLSWTPQADGGSPIAEVGVRVQGSQAATLRLSNLDWVGAPRVTFSRPAHNGNMWQRAWVKGCDDLNYGWGGVFRICQDAGTGLLIQGEREWTDYTVRAVIIPHMAKSAGIAACVQGLQRYVALVLCADQKARLVKTLTWEPGQEQGVQVLAEVDYAWQLDGAYELALTTRDERVTAEINGQPLFDVRDASYPLTSGAVALVIEEGRLDCDAVTVTAC
ncbi:MAG TPA: ADP-ribosylglycohydrolase family protein, partial [Anaerolineae bacterium]